MQGGLGERERSRGDPTANSFVLAYMFCCDSAEWYLVVLQLVLIGGFILRHGCVNPTILFFLLSDPAAPVQPEAKV